MRVRSSQFVFLLLLACSVQLREDRALRLMAAQTLNASQLREVSVAASRQAEALPLAATQTVRKLSLDAHSAAAEQTPWMMPQPALASTAVHSFTGLLRA